MTIFDPASLGTDVDLGLDDLKGSWGLASGTRCLANDLLGRLTCPAGGLFYDDNYGHDLSGLINASLTQSDVFREEALSARECEKDERVDSCQATITLNAASGFSQVDLRCVLVTGVVFDFVFSAADLTVFKLTGSVDPTSAIGAASAAAGGAPVQLVVGPPGGPGPKGDKGDAGASGTSQQSFDFDASDDADNTGVEVVVQQRLVNFDALPATVIFDLLGNCLSTAGTATGNPKVSE